MIKELKETLLDENHNITLSENGAVMYETSGKNLLDLYWKTPSLRAVGPESLREIEGLLMRAMMEDKRMFAKFLFFLRDVPSISAGVRPLGRPSMAVVQLQL